MSAWIVHRDHIDLLVGEMIVHKIINHDDADATGRLLWAENLRSVAYRYPNAGDGQRPGPADFRDADIETYTYTPPPEVPPAVVVGAAHSWDYQSCEHPQFEASLARARVIALLNAVDPGGVIYADTRCTYGENDPVQQGWSFSRGKPICACPDIVVSRVDV